MPAWCPPGAPEPARSTQDLIFFDSGSIFAPPSLRFIDFWLLFLTSKGPSTAKNSQEPPRTRQEPAKTQDTDNDTPHRYLLIEEPRPTATKRQAIKWGGGGARAAWRIRIYKYSLPDPQDNNLGGGPKGRIVCLSTARP